MQSWAIRNCQTADHPALLTHHSPGCVLHAQVTYFTEQITHLQLTGEYKHNTRKFQVTTNPPAMRGEADAAMLTIMKCSQCGFLMTVPDYHEWIEPDVFFNEAVRFIGREKPQQQWELQEIIALQLLDKSSIPSIQTNTRREPTAC